MRIRVRLGVGERPRARLGKSKHTLCVRLPYPSFRTIQARSRMGSRTSIGDDRLPIYPVRVYRIEHGTRQFVRMLSASYGGLFVHWEKSRSHYCPGEDNGCTRHKLELTWKGYTAAQLWDEIKQLWFPVALELTEMLEIDLRGVYRRGQVWELARGLKTKKGFSPIKSTLCELVPEAKLAPEFDYLPILHHLYHRTDLNIRQANPLPSRVSVVPSAGDGPTALKPAESDKPVTPEEWNNYRERMRQLGFSLGSQPDRPRPNGEV